MTREFLYILYDSVYTALGPYNKMLAFNVMSTNDPDANILAGEIL